MIGVSNQIGNGVITHPTAKDENPLICFTASNAPWQLLNTPHSTGLDIVTTAIFEGQVDIADPTTLAKAVQEYTGAAVDYGQVSEKERSASLAGLVRHVAVEQG